MNALPLIERLIATNFPSRTLDDAICREVLGWEQRHLGQAGPVWYAPGEDHPHAASPRFTSSVDDALDLVPVGKWYLAGKGKTREDEPLYGAQILEGDMLDRDTVIADGEHDAHQALAICIAAIRARAALA